MSLLHVIAFTKNEDGAWESHKLTFNPADIRKMSKSYSKDSTKVKVTLFDGEKWYLNGSITFWEKERERYKKREKMFHYN